MIVCGEVEMTLSGPRFASQSVESHEADSDEAFDETATLEDA